MNKPRNAKIIDRLAKLKSMRGTWETHWQEVADYVMPRKATIQRIQHPGAKRNLHLYDSTAIHANEVLSSFLQSMLTNQAQRWIELQDPDPEIDSQEDVRRFLEDSSNKLLDVLDGTNFYSENHEVFLDLGSFGTAAMGVEEDEDAHVRFCAEHIAGIHIDEAHNGLVDTIYRTFKWSARQIVQRWPDSVKSRHIERAMESDPDQDFDVIHAVFPTKDVPDNAPTDLPFTGSYILEISGFMLEEQGFREFPYAVPRWAKATGEIYGRSPSTKGLPDIKMINEVQRTTIRGAQKTIDPPVDMPDDGYLMPIRLIPGGVNYRRPGMAADDRIKQILGPTNVDFGITYIQHLQKTIRDHFFINELQLTQGPQMTATEVIQRVEENLRVLAPVLSRLQVEYLRPVINRTFSILLRRGVIRREDIPEVLSGRNLKVEYTGLIARAQKTSSAQTYLRALQDAAPFIQNNPALMQHFNDDFAVRDIMRMHGVPVRGMRSEDEVEEIKEGQAEAQRQALEAQERQAGLQEANQMAEVAKKLPGE